MFFYCKDGADADVVDADVVDVVVVVVVAGATLTTLDTAPQL